MSEYHSTSTSTGESLTQVEQIRSYVSSKKEFLLGVGLAVGFGLVFWTWHRFYTWLLTRMPSNWAGTMNKAGGILAFVLALLLGTGFFLLMRKARESTAGSPFYSFWKGFFLCLIAGVPVTIIGIDYLADNVTSLLVLVVVLLLLFVFGGIILYNFRKKWNKVLGLEHAKYELEEVIDQTLSIWDAFRTGQGESEAMRHWIATLLSYRFWFVARHWVFTIGASLLSVFVLLIGEALLFKQNGLLSQQNQLLERQNRNLIRQIEQQQFFRYSAMMLGDDRTKFWTALSFFRNPSPETRARKRLEKRILFRLTSLLLSSEKKAACRTLEALYHISRKRVAQIVQQQLQSHREAFSKLRLKGMPTHHLFQIRLLQCQESRNPKGIHLNLRGIQLNRVYLWGAQLNWLNLKGAHLKRAMLEHAQMMGVDLIDAKLNETDMSETDLRFAEMSKADLRGTNLKNADLRYADLGGAIFERTTLRGSRLRLKGAYFSKLTANAPIPTLLKRTKPHCIPKPYASQCHLWHISQHKRRSDFHFYRKYHIVQKWRNQPRPPKCPSVLRGPISPGCGPILRGADK